MAQRIDVEIDRMVKLGQIPKVIEVSDDLYEELYEEQNPPLIAALLGPGETTPISIDREVTEYKGFRVVRMSNVPKDYLNILS